MTLLQSYLAETAQAQQWAQAHPHQPRRAQDQGGGAAALGEWLLELANAQILAQLLAHEQENLLVRVRTRFVLDDLVAACAPYQHERGRPGQPPTFSLHQLCWALLVQQLLGCSLRDLERKLHTNVLVRWCCGFALHERTPDHSTLGRFSLWLCRHQPQTLFAILLRQIDAEFPQERAKVQLGDTFAMHACAADTNRTQMLRSACRALLDCLAAGCPDAHAAVLAQLDTSLLFGLPNERRDEQLPLEQRRTREGDTARGAAHCLRLVQRQVSLHNLPPSLFATPCAPRPDHPTAGNEQTAGDMGGCAEQQERRRLDNWLTALEKMLDDEFVLTDDPPTDPAPTDPAADSPAPPAVACTPPTAAIPRRGSKGSKDAPGHYRIGSTQDLQATYRVHGDSTALGYNIGLLTTDTFVRHIAAFTGARPDGDLPAILLARQHALFAFYPPTLIFDAAAGAPKHSADVARISHGRTRLVAPPLRAGRRGPLFGPSDFVFVEQEGIVSLTCPAGRYTDRAYRSGAGDGWSYRFLASQCDGSQEARQTGTLQPACRCPLWDKCRGATSKPTSHRTVFVSDYLFHQRQAAAYTQTDAFRQEMRQRAAVERIIAGLTRYNGARRATSPGLAAAHFQATNAATAYNLKRWHVLTRQAQRRPKREPPDA